MRRRVYISAICSLHGDFFTNECKSQLFLFSFFSWTQFHNSFSSHKQLQLSACGETKCKYRLWMSNITIHFVCRTFVFISNLKGNHRNLKGAQFFDHGECFTISINRTSLGLILAQEYTILIRKVLLKRRIISSSV